MAKRKIVWSFHAELEIKDILDFYNQRNGSNKFSSKLLKELEKSLSLLTKYPYYGRISSNYKTRVLVRQYISVFYEVMDSRIEIVSIWDNRRDPNNRVDMN